MKKIAFFLISMIVVLASCNKEDIKPNDPINPGETEQPGEENPGGENPEQPAEPFVITPGDITENSVALSWEDENAPFVVKVYSDSNCETLVKTVEADASPATVEELTASTDYWVIVVNSKETSSIKLAVTTSAKETIPALQVTVGKVFWSNFDISWETAEGSETPASFKVMLDNTLVESVGAGVSTYSFTGLEPGSTHSVDVLAVYDSDDESESAAQNVTLGYIQQVTHNVSPTSLCIEFEGKGGEVTTNYTACYKVEMSESDNFDSPFFSEYVVDGQLVSNSSAYIAHYSAGASRGKTRVTIGNLTPDKDYYFRVKCEESKTLTGYYNNAAGVQYTITSPNGTSEFSNGVKFHTAAAFDPDDTANANVVLFEGFDGFSIMCDIVNSSPGTLPRTNSNWPANTNKNDFTETSIKECKSWCFMPVREGVGETQISHLSFAASADASEASKALATTIERTALLVKNTSPGIKGWECSTSFWVYQGYIGLGYDKNGFICTPALSSNLLNDETVTECTFSFKTVAAKETSPKIAVYVNEGGDSTIWSQVYTVAEVPHATGTLAGGYEYEWHPYSCTVSLKKGYRVAISKIGSINGEVFIDDIQIVVKSTSTQPAE